MDMELETAPCPNCSGHCPKPSSANLVFPLCRFPPVYCYTCGVYGHATVYHQYYSYRIHQVTAANLALWSLGGGDANIDAENPNQQHGLSSAVVPSLLRSELPANLDSSEPVDSIDQHQTNHTSKSTMVLEREHTAHPPLDVDASSLSPAMIQKQDSGNQPSTPSREVTANLYPNTNPSPSKAATRQYKVLADQPPLTPLKRRRTASMDLFGNSSMSPNQRNGGFRSADQPSTQSRELVTNVYPNTNRSRSLSLQNQHPASPGSKPSIPVANQPTSPSMRQNAQLSGKTSPSMYGEESWQNMINKLSPRQATLPPPQLGHQAAVGKAFSPVMTSSAARLITRMASPSMMTPSPAENSKKSNGVDDGKLARNDSREGAMGGQRAYDQHQNDKSQGVTQDPFTNSPQRITGQQQQSSRPASLPSTMAILSTSPSYTAHQPLQFGVPSLKSGLSDGYQLSPPPPSPFPINGRISSASPVRSTRPGTATNSAARQRAESLQEADKFLEQLSSEDMQSGHSPGNTRMAAPENTSDSSISHEISAAVATDGDIVMSGVDDDKYRLPPVPSIFNDRKALDAIREGRRIYVGNLNIEPQEYDMNKVFIDCEKDSAVLTGLLNRRGAFVSYPSAEKAQAAIKAIEAPRNRHGNPQNFTAQVVRPTYDRENKAKDLVALAEGRRLYIGNLDPATTEVDLAKFFQDYKVEMISIPREEVSNTLLGHALVSLPSVAQAASAVDKLTDKVVLGNQVSVRLDRPPTTDRAAELRRKLEIERALNRSQLPSRSGNGNPFMPPPTAPTGPKGMPIAPSAPKTMPTAPLASQAKSGPYSNLALLPNCDICPGKHKTFAPECPFNQDYYAVAMKLDQKLGGMYRGPNIFKSFAELLKYDTHTRPGGPLIRWPVPKKLARDMSDEQFSLILLDVLSYTLPPDVPELRGQNPPPVSTESNWQNKFNNLMSHNASALATSNIPVDSSSKRAFEFSQRCQAVGVKLERPLNEVKSTMNPARNLMIQAAPNKKASAFPKLCPQCPNSSRTFVDLPALQMHTKEKHRSNVSIVSVAEKKSSSSILSAPRPDSRRKGSTNSSSVPGTGANIATLQNPPRKGGVAPLSIPTASQQAPSKDGRIMCKKCPTDSSKWFPNEIALCQHVASSHPIAPTRLIPVKTSIKCPQCPGLARIFVDIAALRQHIASAHPITLQPSWYQKTNGGNFQCNFCPLTRDAFEKAGDFAQHISVRHPEQLKTKAQSLQKRKPEDTLEAENCKRGRTAIKPEIKSEPGLSSIPAKGEAVIDEAAIVANSEGRRLYLGNVSYATTEVDLATFFKGYLVESISVPRNPRTERPVGYAFVTTCTAGEAKRAIRELAGKEILERKISIQLAKGVTNGGEPDIKSGSAAFGIPTKAPIAEREIKRVARASPRRQSPRRPSPRRPSPRRYSPSPRRTRSDFYSPLGRRRSRSPAFQRSSDTRVSGDAERQQWRRDRDVSRERRRRRENSSPGPLRRTEGERDDAERQQWRRDRDVSRERRRRRETSPLDPLRRTEGENDDAERQQWRRDRDASRERRRRRETSPLGPLRRTDPGESREPRRNGKAFEDRIGGGYYNGTGNPRPGAALTFRDVKDRHYSPSSSPLARRIEEEPPSSRKPSAHVPTMPRSMLPSKNLASDLSPATATGNGTGKYRDDKNFGRGKDIGSDIYDDRYWQRKAMQNILVHNEGGLEEGRLRKDWEEEEEEGEIGDKVL